MNYKGFYERYFKEPFYNRYKDFSGRENGRDALLSLTAWVVLTCGLCGVLLGLVGLMGPETGFSALTVIGCLWLLASLCPLAALATRAMRGAPAEEEEEEKSATPDMETLSEEEKRRVSAQYRFLNIDMLVTVASGLFLIVGILMTLTTLRSDDLNMTPNGTVEPTENPILAQDSIWEEPIFTYQDETPAPAETDTMADLSEPDTITLSESLDPVIEKEAAEALDTIE